jgi:6-pyruvoyltetrahydropterin/6-carboxytetrahydropterin synthase
MGLRIILEKENFKFSASHFTIWGVGRAERLHGHNYYVGCEIELREVSPDLGLAFDFNVVKPLIRELTQTLDEYILIPENSPYLQIECSQDQVGVRIGSKQYLFPVEDVRFLPLVNLTSEELARFLSEELWRALVRVEIASAILRINLSVEETRGQRVIYELRGACEV